MQEPQQSHTPDQEPERLAEALAKVAELSTENAELRQEVKVLREKLNALIKKLFAASSERIDPAQLQLLLAGLDEPPKAQEPVDTAAPQLSAQTSAPRSNKKREPRTPDNLPIVEERIVPEQVQASPGEWRCIGEERTELLDYEPARFFKRHIVRGKYVRKEQPFAPPVIADLNTMQERCVAAPGLVAAVVVGSRAERDSLCEAQPEGQRRRALATFATIFRSIGRRKFLPRRTTFTFRGKRWRNGWDSPPTGCGPCTSKSTAKSLQAAKSPTVATCKSMKRA